MHSVFLQVVGLGLCILANNFAHCPFIFSGNNENAIGTRKIKYWLQSISTAKKALILLWWGRRCNKATNFVADFAKIRKPSSWNIHVYFRNDFEWFPEWSKLTFPRLVSSSLISSYYWQSSLAINQKPSSFRSAHGCLSGSLWLAACVASR